MTLERVWAGSARGTNSGKLFVVLKGDEASLTGTLHLNEPGMGIAVYDIAGSFDGTLLTFTGDPRAESDDIVYGKLSATASLSSTGHLDGSWKTDIGSAGVFTLYPQTHAPAHGSGEQTPDQLHTARHSFGAVEIDREQIIALAEYIQTDFPNGHVVVTVAAGSEQSRFLEDFKALQFTEVRAEVVKIAAQQTEAVGTNRIVSVEFGQQTNWAMAQGADQSWVLGALEKLKRNVRQYERSYATNFNLFASISNNS